MAHYSLDKGLVDDGYTRGALLVEVGEHATAIELVTMDVLDTSVKRRKEELIAFKL